jgi:hypothetical protein
VLEASLLSLTPETVVLGANPEILSSRLTSVDEKIATVRGSRKEIHDLYNMLALNFEGGFQ